MPDQTKPALKKADESDAPATADQLRALLKRTRAGDATALPLVRRLLESPFGIDLFGGDLARLARDSFVDALAGGDIGLKEAVGAKMTQLRDELLGPSPAPVERLLVERVVACWLQVHDAEARFAQNQGKLGLRQADHYQRRIDAAHRRYLAAVKTLAVVRKLAVPVVQVNIARRQVNVAAPAAVNADGA